MPQPFGSAVITDEGISLLSKAQAGLSKIVFLGIRTGSGEYSQEEREVSSLQKKTGLKNEKNRYGITEKYCETSKSVRLKAVITNQDSRTKETLVEEGYYINEIGLFAKEEGKSDEEAILYSIAVTTGTNGDYLPPYNGMNPAQIIQYYHATVDSSSKTIVVIQDLEDKGEVLIQDDVTEVQFKLGIENGKIYIEEAEDDE